MNNFLFFKALFVIFAGAVMGHCQVNSAGKKGCCDGALSSEGFRHCDGMLSSEECWEGGRCNGALLSGRCRRCRGEGLEGRCKGKEIKERKQGGVRCNSSGLGLRCWKREPEGGGTRESDEDITQLLFIFSCLS